MRSLLLLFLIGLPIYVLPGQEAVVSVRTFLLGGGEMPEALVKVQGENEPVELLWSGSQPTQPLNVIHNGSLQLLHYVEGPNERKTLDVLRAIKIPALAREIILLGYADGGAGQYLAIQDTFMEAKFNDWLAINTSNQTVAFRAGDKGKPVLIEAGASVIFRPDIEEGKGVKVLAVAERNGEPRPFFSTYWPAFSGQRTMIIFYRDGDRMRARRISDRFIRSKD